MMAFLLALVLSSTPAETRAKAWDQALLSLRAFQRLELAEVAAQHPWPTTAAHAAITANLKNAYEGVTDSLELDPSSPHVQSYIQHLARAIHNLQLLVPTDAPKDVQKAMHAVTNNYAAIVKFYPVTANSLDAR
jgi:hypothetical protein